MKRQVANAVIVAFAVALSAIGASCADDVPGAMFSLGGLTIGVSTINDAEKVFGPAQKLRVNRHDEADEIVCYAHTNERGPSFLLFETGPMGGFSTITGFRLSRKPHATNCASTAVDIDALRTGNGVHLEQSTSEFKKVVPAHFKINGSELVYESIKQRAATPEEVKRIRANWPNEKNYQFDVTTIIRAGANADGDLMDIYVNRIESY